MAEKMRQAAANLNAGETWLGYTVEFVYSPEGKSLKALLETYAASSIAEKNYLSGGSFRTSVREHGENEINH